VATPFSYFHFLMGFFSVLMQGRILKGFGRLFHSFGTVVSTPLPFRIGEQSPIIHDIKTKRHA